jgi:hypothetical protein
LEALLNVDLLEDAPFKRHGCCVIYYRWSRDAADNRRRASYMARLRPVLRILEPVEGCEAPFLYLLEESWNGVAH